MNLTNRRKWSKIIVALGLVLLSSSATATTITSEEVKLDLGKNTVEADINVEELTSNKFSYVSTQNIKSVNATVNGEKTECELADSPIGSEIRCPSDAKNNFTVNLTYRITETVENNQNTRIFTYDHPIYRPTDKYSLRVLLPAGGGLVEKENTTRQVISPLGYDTGSNGRQIFVDWNTNPELGDTLSYYIIFENINNQETPGMENNLLTYTAALLILIASLGAAVFYLKREDLSENMKDLTEDQEQIMENIRENQGEYLQKDLVDEMDYSKAKISGEVSKLVEKGMLKKKKEGRSNKLKIPRKYRY